MDLPKSAICKECGKEYHTDDAVTDICITGYCPDCLDRIAEENHNSEYDKNEYGT